MEKEMLKISSMLIMIGLSLLFPKDSLSASPTDSLAASPTGIDSSINLALRSVAPGTQLIVIKADQGRVAGRFLGFNVERQAILLSSPQQIVLDSNLSLLFVDEVKELRSSSKHRKVVFQIGIPLMATALGALAGYASGDRVGSECCGISNTRKTNSWKYGFISGTAALTYVLVGGPASTREQVLWSKSP
jgi:hypothetical protein